MALSDRLARQPSPILRGPKCSVWLLLNDLPEKERAALEEALAGQRWSATELEDEVRAEGHEVSASALSRHRRGRCACARRTT